MKIANKAFRIFAVILISISVPTQQARAMSQGANMAISAGGMILGVAVSTAIPACEGSPWGAVLCMLATTTAVSAIGMLLDGGDNANKLEYDTTCHGDYCKNNDDGNTRNPNNNSPTTTRIDDTNPENGGNTPNLPPGGNNTPNGLPPGLLPAPYDAMTLPEIRNELEKTQAKMEKLGYKMVDGDKIKTPHGIISAKDVSNPAAMSAAGFGQKDLDVISNALKAGEAKAKELADKYGSAVGESDNDGEGGSGGFGASSGGGSGSGYTAKLFGAGKGLGSTKPSTAGLSKSDGKGGMIGVAGDNMFMMITRRYEAERKQNKFFTNGDAK